MTIDQILSNINGKNIANDIASEMNYKSATAKANTEMSNIFSLFKRNILSSLECLLNKEKGCCGYEDVIPAEVFNDKDVMKAALLFIKKQAYDGLQQIDNMMETFLDVCEDEKEDEYNKEGDSGETDTKPEGQVEIPVAMQVNPLPSTNFGY